MAEKKKDTSTTVWFSLKKSLHCKSQPSDVLNPTTMKQLSSILTRKPTGCSGDGGRSGCSRSIANLKDVIHGSKRHLDRPPSCSPRSIGSSEFLNPIAHEVILSNSTCELKITGFHGGFNGVGGGGAFVGTLRPGTPGPGGQSTMHYFNPSFRSCAARKQRDEGIGVINGVPSQKTTSFEKDSDGVVYHKCGEHFVEWDSLESHHLSKHAVSELMEGNSSRKIIEIICRSSLLKSESHCVRIDRVLKVHNMQKTLARFEDYREMVKVKASKLPKKHPRCLADGNELLRFFGTTLQCSLGLNGCSSLCNSEKCCVCRIIKLGFSTKNEVKDGIGVFTTSTSGRAFECIQMNDDDYDGSIRKALIVCRVIAGRVHRPVDNMQEMVGQTGFDSLAGKVGVYSNIEELYLLNPRALLSCFVVIYKS